VVGRVVQSYITESALSSLSNSTKELEGVQRQISSGKISDSYIDLSQSAPIDALLISKENLSSLQSKVSNNQGLSKKLKQTENVLRSMSEKVIQSSINILLQAKNPSNEGAVPVAQLAKHQLEVIENLLNTSYNGQLLFAGSKSYQDKAVENLSTQSNIAGGTYNANYYLGDNLQQSEKISRSTTLEYGISADNDTFKEFIAAHHAMIAGDLDEANDLLQGVRSKLGTLISNIGTNALAVENQIDIDNNNSLNLQDAIADKENVDFLEAMTKLSMIESQIKASFILANRISDLSIVNYIR